MKSIVQVVQNLLKPYIDSNIQTLNSALTNQTAAMVNELGAKNLLEVTAQSQSLNGITFTVNSDGSVSFSGLASATTSLLLCGGLNIFGVDLKVGEEYILSGNPSATGNDYYLQFSENISGWVHHQDKGSGVTFTAGNATGNAAYIVVINGTNIPVGSPVTIKPMIRPAAIQDNTFAPHAKTNLELTNMTKSIAPTEDGEKYSQSYIKGDRFYRNGILYKVTASSVNSSTTISIGSDGNANESDDIVTLIKTVDDKTNNTFYNKELDRSANLNQFLYGIYYSPATVQNNPSSHPYMVMCYGGENRNVQMATRISDGVTYLRTNSSGTWNAWKQVTA